MFWFALGAVVLLCILFTAFEKWTWTTVSLLATGGIYFWMNKATVFTWILDNWQSILMFAGAYLAAGVVWSFGKWFFFLIGFRNALRERKAWYLTKRGLNPDGQVPDNLVGEFSAFLSDGGITTNGYSERYPAPYGSRTYYGCAWDHRPRANDHKSRITAWVGFWPFSMVGTVINDPLRKVIDLLFTWFKGLYQRTSDAIFRNEVGLK